MLRRTYRTRHSPADGICGSLRGRAMDRRLRPAKFGSLRHQFARHSSEEELTSMSATDVRVPVRNGAIRSRPAPRRPAGTRPKAKSAAEKLAPFAAVRAEPINTEMWPLHPVLWLHPELAPGLPCSSGLTI